MTALHRTTIEKGLLLVARHVTGPDGREYLAAVLEYQVSDLDGTPALLTYRGPAAQEGRKIRIGDPYSDVHLLDALVSETPTQRSHDQFFGFCAGLDAKRYPINRDKRHPGKSVEWWDGYDEAWRQKRAT